ncbi:MAG: FHA domain-containing protein [Chloroflexi bacterium]|nr:FHA domain-containing protein [Chloroflexota bacterium]
MYSSGGFRLVVRRGPQPNQVYELTQDANTIGRDMNNEITINDPEVSRHHCRLTRGPSGFTIEDLGSTNGTFVSGRRLTGSQPLNPGDLIGLGETVTLAYEAGPMGAGPAPSAGGYAGPEMGQMGGPPGDFHSQQPAGGLPPGAPQPPDYYDAAGPAPYFAGQPQAYSAAPGQQHGGYYDQAEGRGNRGCGVMIGCSVFAVVGLVVLLVAIIVADTPLDHIPFVSNAANAVPLPGSSVDNAEKFLEALGSCDAEEAETYVCDDDQDAIARLAASCEAGFEDISCSQDGNDVKCDYVEVVEQERFERAIHLNMRNGKVCGLVLQFSDTIEEDIVPEP